MHNEISEYAHLIGDIQIGTGNYVSPGAVIIGPISIGDNNFFGPNAVIGTAPQDDLISANEHKLATLGLRAPDIRLVIGNNNVIREFVTIHQGLTSVTEVGSNSYFMAYSHVAHDCKIGNSVKIANNVQMGGYSVILEGAYLGLSSVLHQFTVIGAHSMIGMGSVVNRSVPPGLLVVGSPARALKVNQVALEKMGIEVFDWAPDYVKSPTLENIHPKLIRSFEDYSISVALKIEEIQNVKLFRSKLTNLGGL
jgi:UDP-N-acetylglucosamine acyltransferase